MSNVMLQNPKVLGVAACADALAAGATRYWTTFNNGEFAAGLFVSSFGADPEYSKLVDTGKIKLTVSNTHFHRQCILLSLSLQFAFTHCFSH